MKDNNYVDNYLPNYQFCFISGQSHNSSYSLYHVGEVARQIIRNFAQYGKMDILVEDGDEDPRVYDQFSTPAVGDGIGETENMVFLDGAHTMVDEHMIFKSFLYKLP